MIRVLVCIALLIDVALHSGCKQGGYNLTEDESSATVRLRNELISLASGKTNEIRGNTQPDEGYVLMYGYMATASLYQLPLPPTVQAKLEDIRPTQDYEIYVLAHFRGNDILEYTRWQNDGRFPDHPILNAPFVIRGSPYRGRLKDKYAVEIIN